MGMLIVKIKRKKTAVAAFTGFCDAFVYTHETEGSGLPSGQAKGHFQHSHIAQEKCRKAAKKDSRSDTIKKGETWFIRI